MRTMIMIIVCLTSSIIAKIVFPMSEIIVAEIDGDDSYQTGSMSTKDIDNSR